VTKLSQPNQTVFIANVLAMGAFIFLVGSSSIAILVVGHRRKWIDWDFIRLHKNRLYDSSSLGQPLFLLLIRVMFFLWCIAMVVVALIDKEDQYFWYFTLWSYSLLTVYFGLTSYYSIQERIRRRRGDESRPVDEEHSWGSFLGNFTWVLYHISFAMVFYVDLVVWGVLFPYANDEVREKVLNLESYASHGINLFQMMVEFLFNTIPFAFYHTTFGILLLCVYALSSWVIYASTNCWVYPILDLHWTTAGIWYLSLFILVFVFFGLGHLLHSVKNRCYHNPEHYLHQEEQNQASIGIEWGREE